ncbi:MAG: EAL domain-containing protein [Gammaproteobacteria bacterium]
MNKPIRVLYVDDSPLDRALVHDALMLEHTEFSLTVATSCAEFEVCLSSGDYDLILSDCNILGYEGLQVLDTVRAIAAHIPVVIVTGTGSEEIAVECMKRGAADYVIKSPRHIQRLPLTIHAVLERKRLQDEHKFTYHALQASEQRFRSLIENSSDAIALFTTDGTVLYASPATTRILGYELSEFVGRSVFDFVHPDDHEMVMSRLHEVVQKPDAMIKVSAYFRHKDDSWRFLEGIFNNLLDDPSVGAIVNNYRDLTDARHYQEQLEYQANHDTLTGLSNRNLLHDRLSQAIVYAQRYQRLVVVAFIDLDNFKIINDSLGHNVGDQLLKMVAARLTESMRKGDTVARHGGDEFVLILNDQESMETITYVMRKILDIVSLLFLVEGREIYITCSIGFSIYPQDGKDAETLLKNADAAMYRAKENGRDNFQFFTAEMNTKVNERLMLEGTLRQALEHNEFFLNYQPLVDLRSGRIIGVEALIRWRHPQLGIVSPAQFIPLAEETGLIVAIGAWVLKNACTQNKAWQEAGFDPINVAVNLSARQFRQKDLVESIAQILHDTRLEACYLDLELTESMVMHNAEEVISTLQELKSMGVGLSIDDFGTGYSSLSYLKRLPVGRLKIDQSFVRDITEDPDDAVIAQAVISLAHSLNLKVIAEGVETAEQLDFLRAHHCDEMQGYYFSRPVSAELFAELLSNKKTLQRFNYN